MHKSGRAGPELSAVSAYFVYEGFDRVNAGKWSDAVSEIENMSRRATEGIEYAPHLFAHARRRCAEHGWIEIALQRDLAADSAALSCIIYGADFAEQAANENGAELVSVKHTGEQCQVLVRYRFVSRTAFAMSSRNDRLPTLQRWVP